MQIHLHMARAARAARALTTQVHLCDVEVECVRASVVNAHRARTGIMTRVKRQRFELFNEVHITTARRRVRNQNAYNQQTHTEPGTASAHVHVIVYYVQRSSRRSHHRAFQFV